MGLPKDWSKKPDWLDKAKEPSYLSTWDHIKLWLGVALGVATVFLLVEFLFGLFLR